MKPSAVFVSRHVPKCFIFHTDKLGGALISLTDTSHAICKDLFILLYVYIVYFLHTCVIAHLFYANKIYVYNI